jgi:signal peptidase I
VTAGAVWARPQKPFLGSARRRRTAAAAGALFVLAGMFAVEPVRVPSSSMHPTVRAGDQVLILKLGATRARRGQLAVFSGREAGELMLKRVAATGGDEVGIEDGVLVVNGRAVAEPYVRRSEVDGSYFGPVRVPAGHVFVLSDNRAGSVDSRTFGPVPERQLAGRAVARLWPPGALG